MESIRQIAGADAEQIFLDWGEPAILEDVVGQYDPGTGRLQESTMSIPVTVIRGPLKPQDRGQTRAQAAVMKTLFLVRESDLPVGTALHASRLRFQDQLYVVRDVIPASLAGVVSLECLSNLFMDVPS